MSKLTAVVNLILADEAAAVSYFGERTVRALIMMNANTDCKATDPAMQIFNQKFQELDTAEDRRNLEALRRRMRGRLTARGFWRALEQDVFAVILPPE